MVSLDQLLLPQLAEGTQAGAGVPCAAWHQGWVAELLWSSRGQVQIWHCPERGWVSQCQP